MPQPNSNTFLNSDALHLHYLHFEHKQSDSLCLLLHGFTNDAHIWDGISEQLSANHHVVAFDFRGHGDSDWDAQERYKHDDLINDVQQLIEHLNTKIQYRQLHIIGHSLGARIAMLWLARHNIKASSLSIIDTGPEVRAIGVNKVRKDAEATPKVFANSESFKSYLSNIYLLAQPEKIAAMAKHGLKSINGELCPKTDPAFTRALWKQDPVENTQASSKPLTAPLNQELWDALEKINCPSLILKGQASAILSKNTAEKMLALLPQAQLQIVERAGHALMVDNASLFEKMQLDFIQANS